MQISSNYSMNGVPYENRRRQNDIPQFSTERAEQENESINPYMEDTDFNEKAFDMIGPNAPQEVKDAWMEAAEEVNANGLGIKKNGMLSHISQMMVQRLNKQMKGEGDVDNIDILGNTTESAIQATKQALYNLDHPLVYVCDCYQKFNVVTGMPKSTFGDSFGYAMQKEISYYMQDFYAGKVSREDLGSYFEKCCTSMRTYRTGQHQTSGTNEADNTQIVSEMYEVFAKENARAAGQVNYQEGKALNEKYYSDDHSDWTYYNSDYYYQCNDTNAALRESAWKMTEKWELGGIDCDEIEANSSLTLDGGFDFNSIWNSDFRNQVGRRNP